MNTPHRYRFDRTAAERLLAGPYPVTGGPPADLSTVDGEGERQVALLLAIVAAPTNPGELAGESAAVRAFRGVFAASRPRPRRLVMMKQALAKIATVKLLAIAGSVLSIGGVALAASTGSLPDAAQNAAHSAFGAPPARQASPSIAATRPAGGAHGSPSPSLHGLCRAFTARPMNERGKALESAAFTALVTAAGGPDKVADYCETIARSSPQADPSHPGRGANPEHPNPSNRPAERGRPSADPDPGGPSANPDHPTGPPASPGRPGRP